MNKLLYSLFAILIASSYGTAQDHLQCGTQHQMNQRYAENPQLEKDYEQLFLNGFTKEDDTTVFIIPMVFHILHEYGSENISDAQIIDQVNILNRDFRLMNADTSQVIQEFKQLYGDAKIEFRLATIDPYGNCTNGIDRVYTHLDDKADDFCKVNQWYRPNYLNVWITNTIGSAGTAGYAYYPNATNNQSFWIDGIIILNDYIGSVGTGSVNNSRALTHEIGHWLGLAHVWGSTNEPMVSCGDDNIEDTPITKGYNYCPANADASKICDTIAENYQNYMDYSYCSRMFTKGQVAAMRAILQLGDGHRNTLITPETHAATGIDLTTPPLCAPIADFNAPIKSTCVGNTITFNDESYNAPVDSYLWTFPGGTPSTSTAANPTVSFDTPGLKTITLQVTNASGTSTKTLPDYINVSENWADFTGPQSLNLNDASSHPEWFRLVNPEYNHARFSLVNNYGRNGSRGFMLNNYKDVSQALPFSDDSYYYPRLGLSVDYIITPSFDLRYTTGTEFSFDYSYASNGNSVSQITENIKVYYSKNCGETWTQMGGVLTGAELVSGGYAGNSNYIPSNDSQWATKTYSYNTTSNNEKVKFKIEFTASDLSSNLFIDNINVSGTGTAGLENDFGFVHDLNIAPNPVVSGSDLKIEYTAQAEPVTFILRNLQGEELMTTVRNETNQLVTFNLEIGDQLPASYYFLEVKSATATTVKKIVVVKN